MTHTQTFIELAIEGGWRSDGMVDEGTTEAGIRFFAREPWKMLLSPLAWQAVGKVKGWKEPVMVNGLYSGGSSMKNWLGQWYHLVTLLADGKSIEEALSHLLGE